MNKIKEAFFIIETMFNNGMVFRDDIEIPITEEAVKMIYEEEIDYELEYAKNYLEGFR